VAAVVVGTGAAVGGAEPSTDVGRAELGTDVAGTDVTVGAVAVVAVVAVAAVAAVAGVAFVAFVARVVGMVRGGAATRPAALHPTTAVSVAAASSRDGTRR
jgi:hypothetical protein